MIDDAMDVDRLVQQALACMDSGDFDRAKALLKKAAAAAPLRADIRDLLTQVMARQPGVPGRNAVREPEAAVADSASEGGSRFWLWMTVGSLCLLLVLGGVGVAGYFLAGRFSLEDVPPGDSLPGLSDVSDADKTDRLKQDDPNAERRKQAADAADRGDYADAVRIMGMLLQTSPPDPRVYEKDLAKWYFELGQQEYGKDRYAAAIDHFSRAARLDGENSEYYFWTGYVHFLRGRRDTGSRMQQELQAAEKALREAIRVDPDNLKAYDTLARTYIGLGKQVPDGRDCYYEIINRAPNSPEATKARKDLSDMGLR